MKRTAIALFVTLALASAQAEFRRVEMTIFGMD